MKNCLVGIFNNVKMELKTKNSEFSSIALKCVILGVLLCVSLFIKSFIYVALTFALLFVLTQTNGRSLYFIVFLMPLMSIFKAKLLSNYLLNYVLFACLFVLAVKLFVELFINKTKNLNWLFTLSFVALFAYFVIFANFNNLSVILSLLSGLCVLFLAYYYKDELESKELIFIFVLSLLFASFMGVFRPISPRLESLSAIFYAYGEERFSGAAANPNVLAGELTLGIALIYTLFLNKKIKYIFYPLLAIFEIVLILTLSKSGMIIFITITIVFVILYIIKNHSKKELLNLLQILGVILVSGLVCFKQTSIICSRLLDGLIGSEVADAGMDTLTTGRSTIWMAYLNLIVDSFKSLMLGYGVGVEFVGTYAGISGMSPHNTYIQMFYYVGLVGVVLMVLMLISSHGIKKFKDVNWFNITPVFALGLYLFALEFFSFRLSIYLLLVLYTLFTNNSKNSKVESTSRFVTKTNEVGDKLVDILKDKSTKTVLVKIAISSVLMVLGFFWKPILIFNFLLLSVFILAECDVKSFWYIVYYLPFMSVFNVFNFYGLNFWFLLVCVFVGVNGIKHIVKIVNHEEKINLPIAICVAALAVYITIPFSGKFNPFNVAECYVWLCLFYIVISKLKEIDIKSQALYASAGFVFQCVVGLLKNYLPALNNFLFYTYDGTVLNLRRFAGVFISPNMLYIWGLICISLLLVLIYNKRLSLGYFALILPIFMACYASMSKTFIIMVIMLFAFLVLFVTIKRTKHVASVLALFMFVIATTSGLMYRRTQSYLCRFFDFYTIEMTVSTNNTQTTGPNSGAESGWGEVETITPSTTDVETTINSLTTGRLDIWKAYINNAKDNNAELFGQGINSATGLYGTNTHNAYIQIFYELGIVGILLLFAIGIYYLLKSKFKVIKCLSNASLLPFIMMAGCFMTENLFLSQVGSLIFILSVFGLACGDDDCFKIEDRREVLERVETKEIQKNNNFQLAVLTPAYNRNELLNQVHQNLKNQTSKDFVWYVVDDGSDVAQREVFEELKIKSNIKMHLIEKVNGGKHTAINEGLRQIKEPMVLILDNDDFLTPDAVERIKMDWPLIAEREDICGLSYLKQHSDKKVVGKLYTREGVVDTFINERYNNNTWGDKCEVIKTDVLKNFPFPEFEGERFLSESTVWCKMSGEYKFLYYNYPIYTCEYLEGGLSDNVRKTLFRNPKGAVACYKVLSTKAFNLKNRVKFTLLYIMHSFACGNRVKMIVKESNSKLLASLLLPFGYFLYLKRKRKFSV